MKPQLLSIFICAAFIFYNTSADAQANKTLSNLNEPTAINADLFPDAGNTRNLGSKSNDWKKIYLSSSLYLEGDLALHATGTGNFFSGQNAGNISLTGFYNTGTGYYALTSLTSGNYNTGTGHYAIYHNTSGSSNVGHGSLALYHTTTGSYNTAQGVSSLYSNYTGEFNTAGGYFTLYYNTADYNTAYGARALYSNTSGYRNAAVGYRALYNNISGYWNTAQGAEALYTNTSGSSNTAIGFEALYANTSGFYNTAVGRYSLHASTTDHYNTGIGYRSLETNTTGTLNTGLGAYADVASGDLSNAMALGYFAEVNASNKVRVGNTQVTSIGGQVGWSTFSDGRFKKDIQENVAGLAFINSLRPVTYTVDINGLNKYFNKGRKGYDEIDNKSKAIMDNAAEEASKIVYDGFIAQEVEEAAQKLGFSFSGVDKPKNKEDIYGLRYDNFVVPLVKAVQELSKENDELKKVYEAKIDNLQQQIDELKSMLSTTSQKNFSEKTMPTTGALIEQNVPNPFKGSTTIHYTLPEKFTNAQIIIADKNGNIVKQINLPAAVKGTVNFDAAALSAGAYSYSLIVNGRLISTKQMMAVK